MRPAAHAQAAIELLGDIWSRGQSGGHSGGQPADRTVAAYFNRRRYAGSKDRAAVTDRVYRVLRHRAELQWRLQRAALAPGDADHEERADQADQASPRAMCIAALCILEALPAAEVEAMFAAGGHGPAPLAEDERRLLAALEGPAGQVPAWVRGGYPAWLEGRLAARFGTELETEVAALGTRAPLDLRVNTLKGERSAALAELRATGAIVEPTRWSSVGIRLPGPRPVVQTEAYRRGRIEVQDEGAQIASLLVDAQPGMQVIDYCAGAGGKALALAATMANRGQIHACDQDQRRLHRARRRLKRAATRNIQLHQLVGPDDPWRAVHADGADRVLVDAPCTGGGTCRRNPEVLWNLTEAGLAGHRVVQNRLLDEAAPLVRQGGRLIYVTCSFFAEENEDVVTAFLERRTDFSAVPIAEVWPRVLQGKCPAVGSFLSLSPARHGTDSFFVAILERAR